MTGWTSRNNAGFFFFSNRVSWRHIATNHVITKKHISEIITLRKSYLIWGFWEVFPKWGNFWTRWAGQGWMKRIKRSALQVIAAACTRVLGIKETANVSRKKSQQCQNCVRKYFIFFLSANEHGISISVPLGRASTSVASRIETWYGDPLCSPSIRLVEAPWWKWHFS